MASSGPGIYDYDQIVAGVNFLWNNRFDEAERIFGSQPNSPRYMLHNAEVAFLRSFITADTNDTQQAMTRLQNVTTLAQNGIKAYEKGHHIGDESKRITNPVEQQNRLLDAKIVCTSFKQILILLDIRRFPVHDSNLAIHKRC
jgi:hypothetical protein